MSQLTMKPAFACHSERSEESSSMNAGGRPAGFFTSFRMTERIGGALLCATGLLFTSCSLPQAQSDPTRFYVLSTPAAAPATAAANAPTVHLRPIEMASYLRARPLIVRKGEYELEFREFARWGESLDVGIARVLREELLARGAASVVSAGGLRSHADEQDFALDIRVLACEGVAHGGVNFRAIWELTKGSAKQPVASGDYHPADLRWDGKTEASLAAQLSRAVTGLAGEIAAGLKK
jgi:hypothetical protein